MEAFDLLGPLPEPASTTVLEASAGTGKTFTLAGLVTRYVTEGVATLDQMLLITFGRAATQELRERVRQQLFEAAEAIADPTTADADNELIQHLLDAPAAELALRRERLRDAIAGFDAATIATTHQFCHLVLRSLGIAGDSETGVTLVESFDELLSEVVDDLYLSRFADDEAPKITRADALALATEAVYNPRVHLEPQEAEGVAGLRVQFAHDVLAELERRKRHLAVMGYDDLLSRLADALEADDAPARQRMRSRWQIVMVDEFQDTDPVQWQVIERAFVGQATVVLIGDPKQAIYAFRGGDIATYLTAARGAGQQRTLGTNWRSDKPLLDRLNRVLMDAELGHEEIVVRDVRAHHQGGRLQGGGDPFRLRVLTRSDAGTEEGRTIQMQRARDFISADLAADIGALLTSGATWDGRPIRADDVAVIVENHRDARACRDALAAAGVPAVYTGDSDVFSSPAAEEWLRLLEAFEQPQRTGLVRSVAVTSFFGATTAELVSDHSASLGPDLTDRVADTLREWADQARRFGIAAVFESAMLGGMGKRVLAFQGGERLLTDLAHLSQVLHEHASREHLGLPALLEWLREQRADRTGAALRNRRLDSDAHAVQIMTVWVSKGLQFPVVYLPFAFNRNVRDDDNVLFHDEAGRRCLYLGGRFGAGYRAALKRSRVELAGDAIRLSYVALTRAQSQVVTWWAPTWDEVNGGLSRLLRGRHPGAAQVPVECEGRLSDADAVALFRQWAADGGPSLERASIGEQAPLPPPESPTGWQARRFTRAIDTAWRRTSYSGLIRAAETALGSGVGSEPETGELDDEDAIIPDGQPDQSDQGDQADQADQASLPSPMAALPAGAQFGSLVHAVLEVADPEAEDLEAELRRQVTDQLAWWPVATPAAELAAALVPLYHTSLGPLAGGVTLAGLPLRDRLCELDFEIPMAGGEAAEGPLITLREVGELLARHLPADDPFAPYADRLRTPSLGGQSLRGYLTGSIDVVFRIGSGDDVRYLVADYKTNLLGTPERPLTSADYAPAQLRAAMLHSDYPLQALLYVVVTHRYLRWRQPNYDPAKHLAGVLYLYVRGMCGAQTPEVDGHPAGVFSWRPPAALVEELSALIEGAGSA